MYSVTAYFFGKVISEIPTTLITPGVFGCIVYYAVGLNTVYPWKFPLFCKKFSPNFNIFLVTILILIYATAGSYALVISTLFADK